MNPGWLVKPIVTQDADCLGQKGQWHERHWPDELSQQRQAKGGRAPHRGLGVRKTSAWLSFSFRAIAITVQSIKGILM